MISNTAERDLGLRTTVFMLLAALATILTAIRPAAAAGEPERLVEKSKITLDELLQDPGFSELSGYIGQAKGVLIFPQLIKGGFIVGGEGGSGVFLVKGADGSWSAPAFYTLAAGSIGLQIGGQVSQVVFTVMNDGAVESILKTNLRLDIYAFSKAAGAFGGGAFEGAGILEREAWNEEYYDLKVSPRDIVINRKVFNASADPLRETLASVKTAQ
jgi:lipid-binding SYLF domain-containing protein